MAVDPTLPPPHLEPCPWCGKPLQVTWRKSNPRASACKTPHCFGNKMAALALDDASEVAEWNRRAVPAAAQESAAWITPNAQGEPDWDDVISQAETATGLPVERHTFSIIQREIRRWLAAVV